MQPEPQAFLLGVAAGTILGYAIARWLDAYREKIDAEKACERLREFNRGLEARQAAELAGAPDADRAAALACAGFIAPDLGTPAEGE